ncbi:MDR family MFS transporter [Domibacillus mangrovi]|uniref:MFS transporter n=1 Tax=Domibacillus mangrovi TaxID=1714354 RepID=A0A1Q5P543_9BACI|nr:MDR family MFS transporter [Domibacillus mangrovi]OKL37271.1 MFS transporter [Domibacillus mangrovi]
MKERQTNRPLVLVAVMMAMFMGAIEATIVATAMPDIVAELGSFSLYSWVFSSYLLMNAATVLIYGKFSDIFGRRPVLFVGIAIFLIGSVLCGFAASMEQMILFRFIQGIGAGAVMPVAATIVGDIYTKEERAKVQGYLASVWGISAVSGPALGGLLVEFVSWRWVFWINVPIGIISIIMLFLFLDEQVEKKKPNIDYIGTVLFLISISSFMYLLVEAGKTEFMIPLLIVGMISLVFFVFHEQRTPVPMIPFHLWRMRPILIANLVSLMTGIMLIGISTFLPMYVQSVMGKSATVAGFTLTAMSIGWPIASSLSGRLLLFIGYRTTTLIGGAALLAGGLMFAFMDPSYGPWWAAASSFVTGIGMGLTSTAFIVSIQNAVDWHERGAATASNIFMRNIGNTIGAALLGGVLNIRLTTYLQNNQNASDNLTIDSINELLGENGQMSESARFILSEGLTTSLHIVYWVVFLFAVVSFILLLFLKKGE